MYCYATAIGSIPCRLKGIELRGIAKLQSLTSLAKSSDNYIASIELDITTTDQ